MNRTVTPEETRQLFDFCHKHFVYYYDLQVELVDHLASSAEEQWLANPELSLEEATKNTFRKFGITGFSKVKEQKQKELTRKYNRLLWNYFIEFYRWPKAVLTIALTMAVFTLNTITQNIALITVIYLMSVFFAGIWYFKYGDKRYEIKTIPGKKFMLAEHLKNIQTGFISLGQLPILSIQFFNHFHNTQLNGNWILFSASFLMVGFTILLYAQFFYIPQKIKDHFFEQYPQFIK